MIIEPFSFTDFSGDAHFGGAVGRVRVLEQRLVPPRRCARAAAAHDLKGAVKELRGTDYDEPLSRVQLPDQLFGAFDEVADRRLGLARKLEIPADLLDLVDVWHAVNHLKREMRAGHTPRDSDGASTPDHLQFPHAAAALHGPDGIRRSSFTAAVQAAEADYARHHSLAQLDMAIDRAFSVHLRETFDAMNIAFLKRLVRHYLDVRALAAVLRWRAWLDHTATPNARPPRVDVALLPVGGYLRPDDLAAVSAEAWERLGGALAHTPYGPMLAEGVEHYLGTGDLWLFEKRADDFLTAFCRLTRYTAFGLEPVVAYGWFVRQETRNVRLALAARAAGVAADAVIPRLREGYDV